MSLTVGVLGYGAIGRVVATRLAAGAVDGVELSGVIIRTSGRAASDGLPELSLDEAIEVADIIVECAAIQAVGECGPKVIAAGCDLLITSIGALAVDGLRTRLLVDGPGRSYLTAGAIGGLDLLSAAARDGGLDSVTLMSAKKANSLVQPWMDDVTAARLHDTTKAISVFEGSVREAIRLFPKSLNVAAAIAIATDTWDTLQVEMLADPLAHLTTHHIHAEGRRGDYRFTISNHPLEENPTTSGLVPEAILHGLAKLAKPSGTFL